ncbi:hypothetical protein Nepgr_000231 [Nepenthes gracilis]|uniref:Uncharacterized protein n=1 Tax=Nepenthes gracilis TaxID=150966 RepID=A0AAD3P3J2_NEPGR|nr:hypothetical protein Nepgr_000231 [Nepenthes gracilis]
MPCELRVHAKIPWVRHFPGITESLRLVSQALSSSSHKPVKASSFASTSAAFFRSGGDVYVFRGSELGAGRKKSNQGLLSQPFITTMENGREISAEFWREVR